MPQAPKLQDILDRNPAVDADKLEEGLELARRLRELGLKKAEYRIAAPGEGRRARVTETKSNRCKTELPAQKG